MLPTDSDFETKVSLEREAVAISETPPFHILFLGDYSGRENSIQNVADKSIEFQYYEIDRDNFEEVMSRLNVRLQLDLRGIGQETLNLNFNSLDDFHPDQIFRQIPLFSELRETRAKLLNQDTFEEAASEVRTWGKSEVTPVSQTSETEKISNPSESESGSSGNLLEDILDNTKAEASVYSKPTSSSQELGQFIREVVQPHIVQTDEVEQQRLVKLVDETTSELMRKILHHPQFKSLESSWRSLYFTVRRIETGNDLKLFLMDISKGEISRHLKQVDDLTDSLFYKKIVVDKSQTFGNEIPWALICGNFEFALDIEDVATLIRISKICNSIQAPFISQVKPQMVGIKSLSDPPGYSEWDLNEETNESKLWTMLRTSPESINLGLALPGFLTRLPYGLETEPTETFGFEEFSGQPQHDKYVWGNPSFLFALNIAQSFRNSEWEIGNQLYQTIDGFPVHLYKVDGETKTKSCAEINMTHEGCDVLIQQGLMPLISFRGTDEVKFAEIQSISFPSKDLNGRWS